MRPSSAPVVVIGAGMGGLAAAIRLAAAGISVTLIEASAQPGGKMRTHASAAGPVDCGPTVLTMRAVFDDLFAAAGQRLEDHVTLIAQEVLARHWWSDGASLDLFPAPERNAQAIRAFAGLRAEAEFRAFTAEARALFNAFDAPMMRAPRPDPARLALAALGAPRLWAVLARRYGPALERRFSDPRLRQLFGRYATYVGGAPDLSPAVLGLIWEVEQQGVWAVRGGMGALAGALTDLATRLGVQIVLNTRVEQLNTRNGQVCGVRLPGGVSLPAAAVVFNGDPAALRAGLLGLDAVAALPASATRPRSLSARVWAFAARPRGADLALHNVFFADSEAGEFGPLPQGRHPQDPTIYVCAQDRAEGTPPPGTPERFEMILNAPPLPHATPDDPTEADTCRQMTFDRLGRMGLRFDSLPAPGDLTRPQDFARRFPASEGALYGRSPHGVMASLLRPTCHTRLGGLYLAGGGVHPGAGVPMATLSGRHAAEAIMRARGSTLPSRPMVMRGGMSTG